MALPNLEWKYVGRSIIGTGTIPISTVIDGIYTLATGTVYYDGSPRIQGSGSAGTWNKATGINGITEAIYMTPPSGNFKIIVAGSSGSASPDMCIEIGANSGYVTNKLFVNIIQNAGNYVSWSGATNPFDSGISMGYVPFLGSRPTSNIGASSGITTYGGTLFSYMFESKESIAIFLIDATNSDSTSYSNGCIAGAIIDPQSTDPLDAETDGRLYGILSTGHGFNTNAIGGNATWNGSNTQENVWSTNWHTYSKTSSAMFLYGYSASASYCTARGGIFDPATGTIKPIVALHDLHQPVGQLGSKLLNTNSGKYIRFPIVMKSATDPVVYGTLRNITFFDPGLIGQRYATNSGTVGHIISCSNNTAYPADAILLEY